MATAVGDMQFMTFSEWLARRDEGLLLSDRPPLKGDAPDQHDARHGRPTKAASPEEGEAAEAVPTDYTSGEGDRAEQADPEVEAAIADRLPRLVSQVANHSLFVHIFVLSGRAYTLVNNDVQIGLGRCLEFDRSLLIGAALEKFEAVAV